MLTQITTSVTKPLLKLSEQMSYEQNQFFGVQMKKSFTQNKHNSKCWYRQKLE